MSDSKQPDFKSPSAAPATANKETLQPSAGASTTAPAAQPSLLNRALSTDNRATAKRFLSAYAETWIGLSPIWLMGEAIIPGKKVGTRFNQGKDKLFLSAREVGKMVSTSAQDVVVFFVDEKLKGKGKGEMEAATEGEKGKSLAIGKGKKEHEASDSIGKTAEVIKAAGENALLIVTSSIEKAHSELLSHPTLGPAIKNAISSNGRDVIVLLDKALKHPVVVTGVTQFAKEKHIPHGEAVLRLASMGLARILKSMPEEVKQDIPGINKVVEELDAAELERSSTQEDMEEAVRVGSKGRGAPPKVEVDTNPSAAHSAEGSDPYEAMRKKNDCAIM